MVSKAIIAIIAFCVDIFRLDLSFEKIALKQLGQRQTTVVESHDNSMRDHPTGQSALESRSIRRNEPANLHIDSSNLCKHQI